MDPGRAFSFPLPHNEQSMKTPPFEVGTEDAAQLNSCEAFRNIRNLLEFRHKHVFCHSHKPSDNIQKELWLLERDIIFALVCPIVEIYRHATELALSMLGNRDIFDLELVFRGEARGAFSWLQCFVAVESNWCAAEGCPACIASYVLQSEPTIRLVLTACRLATSLRSSKDDHLNIPSFDFWILTLQNALHRDGFWGPRFMKDLEPRALSLELGIHAMAQQCYELESLPSPSSSESEATVPASPTTSRTPKKLGTYERINGRMTFMSESSTWLQKIVLGCWATLQVDIQQQR